MAESSDLLRRGRVLAKIVLGGTIALLALLIALPLAVPHESLPDPVIVFWGIFILIVALILGISAAYVFLTRALVLGAAGPQPETLPAPAGPSRPGEEDTAPELSDLAVRLLDGDERRLFRAIVQAKGSILQRDLVRVTAFSDAKVSRLLDRLEGRGLVVRERYGMTNRVRLTMRDA